MESSAVARDTPAVMTIDQSPSFAPSPTTGHSLARLVEATAGRGGSRRAAGAPEATYRQFVEALGVALYITDAAGRITYFNEAAVDLWGRRPQIGEEWCGSWHLFWPDGRPMAHDECPMAIALKENRPVRGTEAVAERPDGSRVHFQPYPTPLRDAAGRLVGGVNVLVDVTDRRRAEADLRTAEMDLAASNAAKDEFLGMVSHELRTPVTTIFGNAQVLLGRSQRLPDTERGMVSDIAEDADRLSDIVENLLLLSRLQSGARMELEPVLLDRAVECHVAAFARRHPDRELAVTASSTRHLVVDADATYLALLLQNLMTNAIKYSDAPAPIDVVIRADTVEAQVLVLDRGLGIDGIATDTLFAPFYRSKEAQSTAPGLGLGLPVCQRIVVAMGGRVWAHPREGGGSEFGFAIPLSDGSDLTD